MEWLSWKKELNRAIIEEEELSELVAKLCMDRNFCVPDITMQVMDEKAMAKEPMSCTQIDGWRAFDWGLC